MGCGGTSWEANRLPRDRYGVVMATVGSPPMGASWNFHDTVTATAVGLAAMGLGWIHDTPWHSHRAANGLPDVTATRCHNCHGTTVGGNRTAISSWHCRGSANGVSQERHRMTRQ